VKQKHENEKYKINKSYIAAQHAMQFVSNRSSGNDSILCKLRLPPLLCTVHCQSGKTKKFISLWHLSVVT
jgi:hypothetical protein